MENLGEFNLVATNNINLSSNIVDTTCTDHEDRASIKFVNLPTTTNHTDQSAGSNMILDSELFSRENAPQKPDGPVSRANFEYDDKIFDADDSTKINSLRLALESKSTTKPLAEKELNLFNRLFRDALSLQDPALRQIFISQTNKLIKRIKDSHRVVMRDRKQHSDEQRNQITIRYRNFLAWLTEFCFDSIYCNAYFGSFILTLSTLKLIIQHITFTDKYLPIRSSFDSKRCYDSILSCLNDSFEENKALALELLFILPDNQEFVSDINLNCFEKIAYQLVESVNPAHSLTCQYVFRMIVGLRAKQVGSKQMTKNQLLKRNLFELVEMLERGVNETQEDFVTALKSRPIYPKLICIRALLNDIDISELESDRADWEKLAKRIVTSSIAACKTVSMIVCNLNPETIGHLPMDLKPVDASTLSKAFKVSLKVPDAKQNTITSQMLLIAGWKTIKECSLSLGVMCVRFWWPKDGIKARKEKFPGLKMKPILDSSDIEKIIEFFDHYLRNLRHRGAFEQAYNGFIMVTRRIWHDAHFRSLLTETLHQVMNDFKCDLANEKRVEFLKAYVTRRSAGLPFIVLAILNSEHKHDSKTLRWVMDCLFEILASRNAQEYQRIHSLNILRALIKESCLGEKVLSYVGRTFAVTLDSFESESFPIRNCANMLLKATVDRTFGSNRSRDEIHRKNQLSFERFFTECPTLRGKMLEHLEKGLSGRKSLASVHAVFVILSRLRPGLNPSEDFRADKVIKPFIEPISRLAYTCPDYKLRELAANLTIRLEIFCTCEHYNYKIDCTKDRSYHLNHIREVIFNQQNLDRNRLHGALSLTKNWIESTYLSLDNSSSSEQHFELLSFARQVVHEVCLSDRLCTNSSIKAAALELAESCCLSRPGDNSWLIELNLLYKQVEGSLRDNVKLQEPQFERLMFKFLTVLPMGVFPSGSFESTAPLSQELNNLSIIQIVDLIPDIISREPSRSISLNLQASLVRFLRQLLSSSSDFVDSLLVKFDIDTTAAHVTPFDELKLKCEYGSNRDKLSKHCEQNELKSYLRQANSLRQIFKFYHYREFRSISSDGVLKFSAKFSNTPRSIELLILAIKNWDEFCLGKNCTWLKEGESSIDKLYFLSQFVSSLPDCDIKCLALLCAGKIVASLIKDAAIDQQDLEDKSTNTVNQTEIKATLEYFSEVLDDLADGGHSVSIRETCSEVIKLSLGFMIQKKCKVLQGCLMNFLSALIKLSQDEEREVRESSQGVMLSLRDLDNGRKCCQTTGGRLKHLIRLIALQLFDSNIPQEASNCFRLLGRIIFNHSKNYVVDINEERGRLFDKTKLNTFADHVATIQCSLEGLQMFFDSRRDKSQRFNLCSLYLPEEILNELKIVDAPVIDNTGDYSWRLKTVVKSMTSLSTSSSSTTTVLKPHQVIDNNRTVDELLENLFISLEYFSNGYWKLLTDTGYTYRELSLYKRIAFLRFVLNCTEHNLKNYHFVVEIRKALEKIVANSCSTTLLHKCLDLMAPTLTIEYGENFRLRSKSLVTKPINPMQTKLRRKCPLFD